MTGDSVTRSQELLPVGKVPAELLTSMLNRLPPADPSILVGPGIGNDAAAIDLGETVLVFKNDPVTFAASNAPFYLANVNANDLACLGATPKWMLATALLPEGSTTPALVLGLFDQLQAACAGLNVVLIGGHTEVTAGVPRPMLVGTMIGIASHATLLPPGGAQIGDRLVLTRPAGIEGTALLAIEREDLLRRFLPGETVSAAASLLHDPGISVVDDARWLREAGLVTALHDPTEGGVLTAVREIALCASHGALVRRELVPVLPETHAIAGFFQIDSLGMLASGSLLATVDPSKIPALEGMCRQAGREYAVIGKITTASAGFKLIEGDTTRDMPAFATDEVSRALARNGR